mgnify:CR=1 FL=1
MKVFGWICRVISMVVILGLVVLAGLLLIPRAMGYTSYAVLSGSMVPTLPVGALVYDKEVDSESLAVGDMVTFTLSDDTIVTHRITAIDTESETVTTKGDANETEDGSPVAFSSIRGKVAFVIPYLGYVTIYAKTPLGIAAVCGVLAVLILTLYLPDALKPEKKEMEHD